ncbi:uncharacterized protein LOC135807952 [Sycon ciliatum]|uniref:uncharacterized protein LOC135807952 n=1 Tax=Sycon ciliatum TaxID=27933 RepID=UPI0031F68880
MSQGSSTRRPGSSGGSSRSAHQRPLRATQTFSQHGGSAASQSALPASSAPSSASADWSSAAAGKKRPSPSSSPFSFRVASSPDPNSRSRSPGSPAASAAGKSSAAKMRRSPGASPVPLGRQDREIDGDGGMGSWRTSRPSSIDMATECNLDANSASVGAAGSSSSTSYAGFIVAGSPNAFTRLPRANSRASVGSVSSELDALVLGTPNAELLEATLDGRRPPLAHLVSRHGSNPNVFTSTSTISPVTSKSSQASPSPTCSVAIPIGNVSDTPRFSPSPQMHLSRRGSNEFESPVLPTIVPVVSGSFTRLMSGSPKAFDCNPPQLCLATVAKPAEHGRFAFAVPDLSKEEPDESKVNITFSQSTVFQQCSVRAVQ